VIETARRIEAAWLSSLYVPLQSGNVGSGSACRRGDVSEEALVLVSFLFGLQRKHVSPSADEINECRGSTYQNDQHREEHLGLPTPPTWRRMGLRSPPLDRGNHRAARWRGRACRRRSRATDQARGHRLLDRRVEQLFQHTRLV